MELVEKIREKVARLPEQEQMQVLDFAEYLLDKTEAKALAAENASDDDESHEVPLFQELLTRRYRLLSGNRQD